MSQTPKSNAFPGLAACMRKLRGSTNPMTRDEIEHELLAHAAELGREMIDAFQAEGDRRTRYMLMYVLSEGGYAGAFHLFCENLDSPDEGIGFRARIGLANLDTKEARRILWDWEAKRSGQSRRMPDEGADRPAD